MSRERKPNGQNITKNKIDGNKGGSKGSSDHKSGTKNRLAQAKTQRRMDKTTGLSINTNDRKYSSRELDHIIKPKTTKNLNDRDSRLAAYKTKMGKMPGTTKHKKSVYLDKPYNRQGGHFRDSISSGVVTQTHKVATTRTNLSSKVNSMVDDPDLK